VATRRDVPFVSVSWLAKLMAGNTACEWSAWFRANYQSWSKPPSTFNQATWQMQHTRALRELRAQQDPGERVTVESQNEFWYRRQSGLVLKGKPDLVVSRGPVGKVFDAKTGMARTSDTVQVMIYMYCLPRCVEVHDGVEFAGCVVYSDQRVEIPAEAVNSEFAEHLHECLDMLEASIAPARAPSLSECRFCDIARPDCPDRMETLEPLKVGGWGQS
jgi:predicted RecB family nuclease